MFFPTWFYHSRFHPPIPSFLLQRFRSLRHQPLLNRIVGFQRMIFLPETILRGFELANTHWLEVGGWKLEVGCWRSSLRSRFWREKQLVVKSRLQLAGVFLFHELSGGRRVGLWYMDAADW